MALKLGTQTFSYSFSFFPDTYDLDAKFQTFSEEKLSKLPTISIKYWSYYRWKKKLAWRRDFFCSLGDLWGNMCAVTFIRRKIGRVDCLQYLLTHFDSFFRTHQTYSNGHGLFCNQVRMAWQNEGWSQKI